MVKDMQVQVFNGLHYTPGAIVQGQLTVSVDKPKKYDSIVAILHGEASVYWTESSGSGDNRSSTSYSNSETYVHVEVAVWKAENSPTGDLPIGDHSFPFSFQLPYNIPASFEGIHGKIRYEVGGKICQSGLINTLLPHKVVARLVVEDRTPGTETLITCSEPVSAEKSKKVDFLCFISGSVSATAKVPRTGFSPGETIPITVDVGNETSKPIRVAANLHKRVNYIARGGRTTFSIDKIARTLSSPINPGVITSYHDENLKVPSDVPNTMRNHSFLSVEYVLDVKVIIPWSFNMDLKIPVVIANPPEVVGGAAPFGSPPGYQAAQQSGYPAAQPGFFAAHEQPGYPAPYPAPQKPPQTMGFPPTPQPPYPSLS